EEVDGAKNFQTYLIDPDIAEELEKYNVALSGRPDTTGLGSFMLFLLPTLIFIGFWYYIFRRGMKSMGGGSPFMSVGKSKAKIYVEKDTKTSFTDVAGADEALEELKEVIDFLKDNKKIKGLGGKMPKGILLVGAPGTGK